MIASPNHLSLITGVNVRGVWIEPVPKFITGELKLWAAVSSVTSVRIPGYWIHKKGSSMPIDAAPVPGEKVVYALHGGGFISLSASPEDPTAAIARGLLKHADSIHRVFSVEYRLSSNKPLNVANPFPAALLDTLAGYNYLVNVVGFSPADIIVEGDSAGGNLALALIRYLIEHANTAINLPSPPSALILLSPWCDLGHSHFGPDSSASTCVDSDYIYVPDGENFYKHRYVVGAFTGPHGIGAANTNVYISPASLKLPQKADFSGFPRTFIVAGGAEVLRDQIRTLRDKMVGDLGEGDGLSKDEGKVRYHEAPDGIHDYLVFSWHEPERTETLRLIAKWVAQ